MYLLYLLVCGNASLGVALLLEPGADGLQRAVGAAPAVIVHAVLHVVMIAVHSSHHEQLEDKQMVKMENYCLSVCLRSVH